MPPTAAELEAQAVAAIEAELAADPAATPAVAYARAADKHPQLFR